MLRRLRRAIRYFFGISHTEVNAILALTLIVILVILIPSIYKAMRPATFTLNDSEVLDSLIAELEKNIYEKSQDGGDFTFLVFDPNKVTLDELEKMGVPSQVAGRIANYRNAGGSFRQASDLQKIYGLDSGLYTQLRPYIVIENPSTAKPDHSRRVTSRGGLADTAETSLNPGPAGKEISIFSEPTVDPFDLNKADTTALMMIAGIGPVFSRRIIKFREGLGGFVSVSQLGEVYGLDPDVVESIKKVTFIHDSFVPRTLSINKLPADSLGRHPYISSNQARVIKAFQGVHGPFSSAEDLLQISILDSLWLSKVRKYLNF